MEERITAERARALSRKSHYMRVMAIQDILRECYMMIKESADVGETWIVYTMPDVHLDAMAMDFDINQAILFLYYDLVKQGYDVCIIGNMTFLISWDIPVRKIVIQKFVEQLRNYQAKAREERIKNQTKLFCQNPLQELSKKIGTG